MIPTGSQVFDLAFAPNTHHLYTGLLNGRVKGFTYDEQGQHQEVLSVRPAKKSCRGLAVGQDGAQLWAVGKAKAIFTVDLTTGTVSDTRVDAHDSTINRINLIQSQILATGDDNGVIKLWDTRQPATIRTYTHHFDFITDILWMSDKKQLISTSGDGTLSVIDIRSSKTTPLAHSEDQEDELLSIIPIRGGAKFVVGTQQGPLHVFSRSAGWADCVDRIPGHPHSVDALCAIPSSYPSAHSTILTGSSDGMVRAVQLYPTKLLGAVADHGDWPVEKIKVELNGEGRWMGSVGHEEGVKLTDLKDVFEDDKDDEAGMEEEDEDDDGQDVVGEGDGVQDKMNQTALEQVEVPDVEPDVSGEDEEVAKLEDSSGLELDAADKTVQMDSDADSDAPIPQEKKRKRKERDPLNAGPRKKGRDQMDAEKGFFGNL